MNEAVAAVVLAARDGLLREPGRRWLPPWLFYDEEGSRLFEEITALPEYYLTRAERSVFESCSDEIVVAAASVGGPDPLTIIELGAGTATKSQILLAAVVRRQRGCVYIPVDVSAGALAVATDRIALEVPGVEVRPLVMHHEAAFTAIREVRSPRLVLFIGSSIGNHDDGDAVLLLRHLREVLSPGDALVIGADRVKSVDILIPAYDDAAGVTARFNLRALHHLNDALGANFDVARFRHVAVWNAEQSRIEMHLESLCDQRVSLGVAGAVVAFSAGERIHTESSHKYTDAMVASILRRAGFTLERSWMDDGGLFGVHLGRA